MSKETYKTITSNCTIYQHLELPMFALHDKLGLVKKSWVGIDDGKYSVYSVSSSIDLSSLKEIIKENHFYPTFEKALVGAHQFLTKSALKYSRINDTTKYSNLTDELVASNIHIGCDPCCEFVPSGAHDPWKD